MRARKEFKLLFARVLSKTTKLSKVNKMFERAETTLCLVISLDGKITTGSTDSLDSDSDWKRIVGVKEGFAQYYKMEQSLGPN